MELMDVSQIAHMSAVIAGQNLVSCIQPKGTA